ncbi:MAG: hypothetical protein IPJ65_19820 [Archangiaceae bacterium]|nr:hypothetical protein [Archangiaceae bacterium]
MSFRAAARIRLEGRLETVEGAAARLRAGLEAARRHDYELLRSAVERLESAEVEDARVAVAKLSEAEPALRATVSGMNALLAQVDRVVQKRLRALGMAPSTRLKGLVDLCDDPVVYGSGRRPLLSALARVLVPTGAAGAIIASSANHRQLGLWFIAAPLVVVFAMTTGRLTPMNVTVTRKRLVLKDVSVPLSAISGVSFASQTMRRSSTPIVFTVDLHDGGVLSQALPRVDPVLVQVLRDAGVTVDDHRARRLLRWR